MVREQLGDHDLAPHRKDAVTVLNPYIKTLIKRAERLRSSRADPCVHKVTGDGRTAIQRSQFVVEQVFRSPCSDRGSGFVFWI